MNMTKGILGAALAVALGLGIYLVLPRIVGAHCDTPSGPMVTTAQACLETGNVTPLLKWVKKSDEATVREAFKKAIVVRKRGREFKELADTYFLETVVRLHVTGEGGSFTGLKPANTPIDPAVVISDRALESGSVEELIKMMTETMANGIRMRFNVAFESKKHADDDIDEGREFVDAYREFTHYVETVHDAASVQMANPHPRDPHDPHDSHKHNK
jgi:hypothetical protein